MRKNLLLPLLTLSTLPASAQWQAVSNPVPINSPLINAQLDAIDAQTAWFINSSPSTTQFSRTVDGGQTWQNVGLTSSGASYTTNTLEAIDALHAWVIMSRTTTSTTNPTLELYHTADGGATWMLRALPAVTNPTGMLHFFSLTEGIVLDRASGALYRTIDGGISWQLQSTTPTLSAGQFLLGMREASGVVWANVYNVQAQPVAFWASTDRGLTWRSQSIPVAPSGVVFRDAQHALLSTPQGGMLSSTDGGLTWQNATAPPFRLGPLTAVPGTRAYVAGAEHWIGIASDKGSAVTYDDGQTWTMLESTNSYQTILFTSPNVGWHLRASFAAPTVWYEYEGIGRYVGGPLANRAANKSAIRLEVFPNPSTSGSFTLRLPTAAGHVNDVRVVDALGRTVYHTSALPTDQRLDLSQQPKGLYSLQLQTDDGLVRSRLLIE